MERSHSLSARILVLGATSQVAYFLLPLLARRGFQVVAVTRGGQRARPNSQPGVIWRVHATGNLDDALNGERGLGIAVVLSPLPSLPPLVPDLARLGVRRIVALGTTGRFYKLASSDSREREHMLKMDAAERQLVELCGRYQIDWTLFRPTLIYGCGLDRNITFIAKWVRRFGFFPVVGDARGLRQPVHAEDLAYACLAVLDNAATFGKAYNLSGGSTLAYREMVAAVFHQLNRPVRIPRIPLSLFRAAIAVAKLLPGLRGLSTDMATRMSVDMCFDHSDAARDFGFSPRSFVLDEQALLLNADTKPLLTRAGL